MGQETRRVRRVRCALIGVLLSGVWAVMPFVATPVAAANDVVISQVYTGGGSGVAGTTYKYDYVELFNRSGSPVTLTNYSIQYASASNGNFNGADPLNASVTIPAGGYYLVRESSTVGTVGADVPNPDETNGGLNLSNTAGKVALVESTVALACGGTTACSTTDAAKIKDSVAYGSGVTAEGSPAPGPANTTQALLRAQNGCQDTDMNNTDFAVATPAPRNSMTAPNPCGTPTPTISVMPTSGPATGGTSVTITGTNTNFVQGTTTVRFGSVMAVSVTVNSATSLTAVAPPAANMGASSTVDVVATTGGETATATMAFTYIVANGPTIANIRPAYGPVAGGTTVTITGTNFAADSTVLFGANAGTVVGTPTATSITVTTPMAGAVGAVNVVVSNPTAGTSVTATNGFAYVAAATRIHDLQGASHRSPLEGMNVTGIAGIVTAKTSSSFYIQEDPAFYDASVSTSEGVLVFGSASAGMVTVGNVVTVSGNVQEFRPGGTGGGENLRTTEIGSPTVMVLVTSSTLPEPVVIGAGGRQIPTQYAVAGDYETPPATFDPATYALDFFESLEGMRVQVNDAKVVGPRANTFGEFAVVPDNGAALAGKATTRGGLYITSPQDNPQRIFFDDTLTNLSTTVPATVGDSIMGATVGIIDYSFGNYKFNITSLGTYVSGGLMRESTALVGDTNRLTVGNFNLENLAPGNPQSKFDTLAGYVKNNLRSPDIIVVEEVQDNNGATDDGTVAADATYNKVIAAITAAGGPAYQFRQIDPVNDMDGGEPGGNIRVGFLFNPARVTFVDRPGGTPTAANSVITDGTGTHLLYSPGRIDPTNTAFTTSRKPLAGEFTFNGNRLFVIANHFNSKGGDTPLYGRLQPPTRSSEVQRQQQALIVHTFVRALLMSDANARVVIAGDLNDYQFSDTLKVLRYGTASPAPSATPIIEDLVERLPQSEQYTYVFEGNSQVLDHILVSTTLSGAVAGTGASTDYDVVHLNSEFYDQISDHDAEVVRLTLPAPAIAAISPNHGPTSGGTSVTITGVGFRPGATVTFDGVAATSVAVVSDTTITAVSPAGGAGPKEVIVRNTDAATTPPQPFVYEQPNIMPVPIPTRAAGMPSPMLPTTGQPVRPMSAPGAPTDPTPLPAPPRR